MNVALRTLPTSREQFLDWVQRQEGRFEFDGTAVVDMTGASRRHGRISHNLFLALGLRLRGGPYECLGPDAAVATIGNAIRFPDVLVTPRDIGAEADMLVPQPVVVIEVLSPSSQRIDRITKLREYASVGSLRAYVIVEQSSPDVTVYERSSEKDNWSVPPAGMDAVMRLPSIGVEVPIEDIFAGVTFQDAETEQ